MPQSVSDIRSNLNDQIDYAARAVGKGPQRQAVYRAIQRGKAKWKSVADIAQATGLSHKRVLEEGRKLVNKLLVRQQKVNGEVQYEKDAVLAGHIGKILKFGSDRKALAKLPTKTRPAGGATSRVTLAIPNRSAKVKRISVDDIDSFSRVRKVPQAAMPHMSERAFKEGVQRVINETGTFRDWGGESNDLFSTRIRFGGKRKGVAFGFKGPGKKGKLTPKGMGKNGDQIPRLFNSTADIFLVQYWAHVDESIYDLMHRLAITKAYLEDRPIWYGVIDGDDSGRLVAAYRKQFKVKDKKKGK